MKTENQKDILRVIWTEEDVCEALRNADKEYSPENISRMISADKLRFMEERLIELGREMLNSSARQL